MKKLWTILIVIIVLLILFLLLGPFYMVNEGEQAVITRFGRIVDTETTSGLKLKMPVIDTVTKYPKMLLSWDGDAQKEHYWYYDRLPGRLWYRLGYRIYQHDPLSAWLSGQYPYRNRYGHHAGRAGQYEALIYDLTEQALRRLGQKAPRRRSTRKEGEHCDCVAEDEWRAVPGQSQPDRVH